jgi:hypothetical protein
MKLPLRTTLFITVLTFFAQSLSGQNLENIGKEKPIKLSSGLSLQYSFYAPQAGGEERQSPTNWVLSGSPTVSLYGVSFPFSFTISQQNQSYNQPFNRFGVTPQYKWLKAYLGWCNMNFSNYTFSGRQFLGGGVELTPGILRFGALYGRFQQAIREDSLAIRNSNFASNIPTPAFDRRGYAFKIGIGKTKNFLDFSYLRAQDDINSIPNPEKTKIYAAENAAFGINSQLTFFKRFVWRLDAGISGYTRDLSVDTVNVASLPYQDLIKKVLLPRYSTQVLIGGETSLGFRSTPFSLELKYKRIDPDFKSMGCYYFQTDIEQYSAAPSFNIGKAVRVSGSIGLQKDNLYKRKLATTERIIGSANVSINPGSVFGMDINYTNFGITQSPGIRSLSDSTRLSQISQSVSVSPRLTFSGTEKTHSIFLFMTYNDLAERNPNIIYKSDNQSFSSNVGYSLGIQKWQANFSSNLNYTTTNSEAGSTKNMGIGFSVSKSFFDSKLSSNAGYNWYKNYFNAVSNGSSSSASLGLSYALFKNQSLSFQTSYLSNNSDTPSVSKSFSELYGSIGYSLNF